MLHFLQNITYYMMVEVIEPHWHDMTARIRSAASVDDILACHEAFQDDCLRECLLTSGADLLKKLTKLITLCLLFANQISDNIDKHRLSNEELDRRAGESSDRCSGGVDASARHNRDST